MTGVTQKDPSELQVGDWLEHEAFQRTVWLGSKSVHHSRLAEILDVTRGAITLHFVGESGGVICTHAEIIRWWNPFDPTPMPEDSWAPNWVKTGDFFEVKEFHAFISMMRLGWISFFESGPEARNVLRLMPYEEFKANGWVAKRRLSRWEWLRNSLV
jgi:hypothetical protein